MEGGAEERRSVTLRRHRGAVLSTGEGIADGLGSFAENISTREYQDKQGAKRQAVEVVVAGAQGMVNVLSPKADGADHAGGGGDEAA